MLAALLLSFGMAIGGIAAHSSVAQEALVPGIIDFGDDRNRGVLTRRQAWEYVKIFR